MQTTNQARSTLVSLRKDLTAFGPCVRLDDATTTDDVCRAAFPHKYSTIPAFGEVKHQTTGETIRSAPSAKHNLIVRTDGPDGMVPLGFCGAQHVVSQPRETMAWLDSLTHDGQVEYVAAGSLDNGAKIWVACKIPALSFEVVPGDEQAVGFLVRDSFDQSRSLSVMPYSLRYACNNLYSVSQSAETGVKIRHSGDIAAKMKHAASVLGVATERLEVYKEFCRALASERFSVEQAQVTLECLIPDPKTASAKRSQAKRKEIMSLFKGAGRGSQIAGVGGTKWGFFNAVTEYTTHRSNKDATKRFTSTVGGAGNKLATNAARLLLSV